jgi:hypothetical protein
VRRNVGRSIKSLLEMYVDFQTAEPIFLSTVIKTAKDSESHKRNASTTIYWFVGFASDPPAVFTQTSYICCTPKLSVYILTLLVHNLGK